MRYREPILLNWENECENLTLEQARDRMPFLERFINDWAIEDLVKQFMKNRRSNHYRKGWLDVPEKYEHLKVNAQKRDRNGSRKKKALSVSATSRNRASTSTGNQGQRAIRVAGTRVIDGDDDDDDEEVDMGYNEGPGQRSDEEEE
jgi:hypothetical protein